MMIVISLLFAAVFLALLAASASDGAAADAQFRARFDSQFLEAKLELDDPQYQFDGASAEVIATIEEIDKRRDANKLLSIERYARNAHGEYFLVRSNESGKPFVKHVTHRIAKVVLAERYIEPVA